MSLRWIPNAICIVRVLLVFPLVLALLEDRYGLALTLVVVAGASDALDGFLAKTFDWRTRLGSLLDPGADKLLVTSVFIVLTYLGWVPVLLTVIVIMRDVIIVIGTLAYQFVVGELRGEPTRISKLNTACQLAFLLFMIMYAGYDWPPRILLVILGACVVYTSITSGLNYVLIWSKRAWQKGRAVS